MVDKGKDGLTLRRLRVTWGSRTRPYVSPILKAPILFHFFEKHPKVAVLILRWGGRLGTGDAPVGAAQ